MIPKKEETPDFYDVQITSETKIYQFILPVVISNSHSLLLEEISQEFAAPEDPDNIIKSLKGEIVGELEEQGKEISPNKLSELIKEMNFVELKVGDKIVAVAILEEDISQKREFEASRVLLIKG